MLPNNVFISKLLKSYVLPKIQMLPGLYQLLKTNQVLQSYVRKTPKCKRRTFLIFLVPNFSEKSPNSSTAHPFLSFMHIAPVCTNDFLATSWHFWNYKNKKTAQTGFSAPKGINHRLRELSSLRLDRRRLFFFLCFFSVAFRCFCLQTYFFQVFAVFCNFPPPLASPQTVKGSSHNDLRII